MDSGSLEAEYRTRCQNYETALKKMRQELLDAKADALNLSKVANDDRKKCLSLQCDLQKSAFNYSELCTKHESIKLSHLKEKEEYEQKIKILSELNVKLEARASHAEGEASRAIAEHRESKLKWELERRAMGIQAVTRIHHRHRVISMKRGLHQWKRITLCVRLSDEFKEDLHELRVSLETKYEDEMRAIQENAKEKECSLRLWAERASCSRDRLAEERASLLLAARGYGPGGVLMRWRIELLNAKRNDALRSVTAITEEANKDKIQLQRVRESFAILCVKSLLPRMLRQAMRQRFVHWSSYCRHLAREAHAAEVGEGWHAADQLAMNMKRIRRSATNLVAVSISFLDIFSFRSLFNRQCLECSSKNLS